MRLKSKMTRGLAEYITSIKHPEHSERYRNDYIKYYYIGIISQFRHLLDDRVFRRKYREINFNGEFGPELKYAVPFAYWHHCNGTLKKTISSVGTQPFYFFSENHEERHTERTWKRYFSGVPNSEDHNVIYNLSRWKQVPFKQAYANSMFKFDKPVLIVANKYNVEWDEPPVNFLGIELLRKIFSTYSSRYQIVYNRPGSNKIVNDNSDILSFEDHELIKTEHPDVIDMDRLFEEAKSEEILNYNHFQLLLYANTERFISVHGGASVLASYFGGKNIIFSVKGFEHYFKEFEHFYPKLSGAEIFHARSEEEVLKFMSTHF